MRTRYDRSPWLYEYPASSCPKFEAARGSHTVDVVIVGAGLTGCAAAYWCASAGLRTVVLEASRVGAGAAAHGAGLLLPEPGPTFLDVKGAHGLRAARTVFETWRRGALEAATLLKRLRIPCGLESIVSMTAAWRSSAAVLERECKARQDAGLDVAWLRRPQVEREARLEAAGALRMGGAFVLDPYRAALGLARAASRRRARIFERSGVRRITFDRRTVQAASDRAVFQARALFVTTGVATREVRALQRHFKRRETYLALTEPLPPDVRRELPGGLTLTDAGPPRHRLRWTKDHRLMICGADQDEPPAGGRDTRLVQRTGQLMYELSLMYPAISGVRPAYGWSMPYGDTTDGLPYIGRHRNFPHHVFALGGRGDSMTGAFLAARILVRDLQAAAQKADAVFSWLR
ncbi:MAG: FAD-binding oxidoreductase [Acidimicrobiia bacterium]|nr:FAD-binding oxidoreductase [Acidimicrobiia bacterium]